MADRKNIKVSPDTHERLAELKPENHTWDGYLDHLLDAYQDPRPRIPSYSGMSLEEYVATDPEEMAERARNLQDQVDFTELLQETDDTFQATAGLIAELTADRVVEKLVIETND